MFFRVSAQYWQEKMCFIHKSPWLTPSHPPNTDVTHTEPIQARRNLDVRQQLVETPAQREICVLRKWKHLKTTWCSLLLCVCCRGVCEASVCVCIRDQLTFPSGCSGGLHQPSDPGHCVHPASPQTDPGGGQYQKVWLFIPFTECLSLIGS